MHDVLHVTSTYIFKIILRQTNHCKLSYLYICSTVLTDYTYVWFEKKKLLIFGRKIKCTLISLITYRKRARENMLKYSCSSIHAK